MVIWYVLAPLEGVFVVITAWRCFRAFVHRIPFASGDTELAAELGRVGGRRTRRLAVGVIDPAAGSRMAFIDADKNTRFELGSITKTFTGMLLAEAIRRGEVSLDSTVAAHMPDCAASPLGSVTMRELCTHTSGLPRLPRASGTIARAIWFASFGSDPYRGLTPSTVLEQAKRQRLSHRGRQRYSNLGAAVLGQVLASVAGCDFPTLLIERVFAPLGMHDTRVAGQADAAQRGWTAAGRHPQAWVMDGYSPAGGVVTTMTDMTLLASALLDGSAPGKDAMESIGCFVPTLPARASGMFWIIDSVLDSDRSMVWHNGQTGGYSAFLALNPHTRSGVVVLANLARATEQQRIAIELTR